MTHWYGARHRSSSTICASAPEPVLLTRLIDYPDDHHTRRRIPRSLPFLEDLMWNLSAILLVATPGSQATRLLQL
jgi:hypothetical protein